MIDCKELRIGNILKYYIGEDGCEWDETTLDAQDIVWAQDKNENFNKVHKPVELTPELLERVGFKAIPHYTVQESMTFEVGRLRYLSIGDIGTPNEMLWLCERDRDDANKVNDLICLHNYDYDGKLYLHKLQNIVHTFGIELNPF